MINNHREFLNSIEAVSKGQPFYIVDNQAYIVDKFLYKDDNQLIEIIIFVA